MKKILSKLLGGALLFGLTMSLTSCEDILGQWDKPIPQTIVNAIVEKTGATPEEVTALINEAMSDAAVQQALSTGEPIQVVVAGGSSTTTSNQTITIPMTTAGAGENKVIVDLTFTGAISATEENPLEFKADAGADAGATDSDNQLNINMPAATGLVITINLPKTTVVLTSSGSGTVYKTVNSKTAMETLIISEGVTVEELLIADGTVIVKEGGKVESYVYQPDTEDEKLIINQDGSVEPQTVYIHGEEKFELRHENGDPYYASKLKVRKGEADYANIFYLVSDPTNNPLKVVTICDGAVLQTNWISMETIEGQGTAKIKYRLEFSDGTNVGFYDDSAPGTTDGPKWFQYQCDMYHLKTLKNIIFVKPEIVLWPSIQEQVTEKENEGYVQRPTMLNLDVNESVENCEFNFDHVHFCPWTSYPLVKECKFVPTGTNTDKNVIEANLDNRGNNFDVNALYSMSFNKCTFGANTIFKINYGTMNAGTIDFTDCEYNGQSLDDLDLLNQIIYCQVIISINGVAKYQSSFDADSPTKWKVTAI